MQSAIIKQCYQRLAQSCKPGKVFRVGFGPGSGLKLPNFGSNSGLRQIFV